ncbi:MAG: ribosome biogenesis GTPase YlqF [bacterium]|nr:ribosome biogenesis GTPase YlqF [bacterium]
MNNSNEKLTKVGINWYPGHMAKTRREIKEKIDLIDIVFEVVDARMPISSKIVDIDTIIREKPHILIMTKYDICDEIETNKIIEHYKNRGYDVINVDLMNGKNVNKIIEKSQELLKEMNAKRKEKGLKPRSIRALIVGSPNVGKSTLINRLVGKKVASIGNRPGVTKNLGWIRIHKDIDLLDSPGILWPKLENQYQASILASLSSIKEEILDQQQIALFILEIMNKLYPNKLKERYGIENINLNDIEPTLELIAKKRGALMRGGVFDYDKVYSIIIRDLKDGNFGKVTLDRLDEQV